MATKKKQSKPAPANTKDGVTPWMPSDECPECNQHHPGVSCDAFIEKGLKRLKKAWAPLSLSQLRKANVSRSKKWSNGKGTSLEFSMMELAGETGEACNAAKKLSRLQQGMAGGLDTTENLAEELADVIISADLAAMQLGIDLSEAVRNKFNATSKKHGFPDRL